MYVGRIWLQYTEAELWQLTPRQLAAQLKVHEDITKQMRGSASPKSSPAGFIDQIPGW